MKKLTAGIFTVLLGVVAANSADAALTSQKYVDAKVKVNADAIADLTTTVGTKADASTVTVLSEKVTANTDAIAKKADSETVTAELGKKQNTLTAADFVKDGTGNVVTAVTVGDDGKIKYSTASVATSEELGNLQTTVAGHTTTLGTLTGDGDGSIAKSIADAITTETARADAAYDAKGAAATAEQNAKTYADGLAGNYATTAQGKTADDTAAAVNNATTGLATKASTTYVNEELAKKQNTLKQGSNITIAEDGTISATYEYDDSGLAGRVTTLEGTGVTKERIDAIATNTENITKNTEDIAKKQDALTEAQLSAVNSGITATKVTTYDGYDAKITAAQTKADQGVTDAAAAKAVADKAIPAPTDACTTLGAKCVLTVGNNGYAWESVERDASESTGE